MSEEQQKRRLFGAAWLVLVLLAAFLAVKIITEVKMWQTIGQGSTPPSISVSGEGSVEAVPDIATVTYTIIVDAKTVSDAQAQVTTTANAALAFLKNFGIADADISTNSYNSLPQYATTTVAQPMIYCVGGSCPPPQQSQTIVGYEVTESVSVKVRNPDDAGKVIDGLTKAGVKEVSGPNFTIDNPDALQDQARAMAITDAQSKAQELAKELDVHLGAIQSFSDNSGTPIIYSPMALNAAASSAPAAPPTTLPQGQQKITSDVTITFAIN